MLHPDKPSLRPVQWYADASEDDAIFRLGDRLALARAIDEARRVADARLRLDHALSNLPGTWSRLRANADPPGAVPRHR